MTANRRSLLLALLLPVATLASEPRAEQPRHLDIEFASHGSRLMGSLVLPANGSAHAAVVFVHGSGPQARDLGLAELFARQGIAALVYDKRGAGSSGGTYEGDQSVSGMNIALLADDAAAALQALRNHPAIKGAPTGLAGISQAGWIVPLAAKKSGLADFLVLWSAPVCKVSEEDIYSKFTGDRDGAAPPYAQALAARTQPYIWPDFLGVDTDPAESLRGLAIPGFWIFSDNDGSIPVDLSIARLRGLRNAGHRYDHMIFSGLGHNNIPGTLAAAADWIRHLPR